MLVHHRRQHREIDELRIELRAAPGHRALLSPRSTPLPRWYRRHSATASNVSAIDTILASRGIACRAGRADTPCRPNARGARSRRAAARDRTRRAAVARRRRGRDASESRVVRRRSGVWRRARCRTAPRESFRCRERARRARSARLARSSKPAASARISALAATRRTCMPVSASFASMALSSVSSAAAANRSAACWPRRARAS